MILTSFKALAAAPATDANVSGTGPTNVTPSRTPEGAKSLSVTANRNIIAQPAATTATTLETTAKTPAKGRTPINGESVADSERSQKADVTMSRFEDILNVKHTADCENIDVDLDSYTDEITVAASLSKYLGFSFNHDIGLCLLVFVTYHTYSPKFSECSFAAGDLLAWQL